ncbi:hypothetical protein QBE55_05300 [Eubacteriales bacterium mix99]|jgi:hypothetical protein|nr:hypothetical protein [Clostridiales bacterium]
MYKFTDWVPSYYLLDEDGVIQATSTKLQEAIQFLPQKQATSEQLLQLTDGKPLLVGIDRCDACLKAYTSFRRAGESVCYAVQGLETEADASFVDTFADPHCIISHAFEIDIYPTYLYVDKQGTLIADTER